MKQILVVVEADGTTTHVIDAAVERARRERASLVVLNVLPETVYERRQDAIRENRTLQRNGYMYGITQATETARGIADRAAHEAIGEHDVPYTSVGIVGAPLTAILQVAAAHNCDEIVTADTKPRWFTRARRFDRALTRGFGGTVTRLGRPTLEPPEPVRPVPEL